MRERSVWRWWGSVLLVAVGLLLLASLPTAALADFFSHPEHPWRQGPNHVGALWLRIAAVATAIMWVAGALLLLRWRSDADREPGQPVSRIEVGSVALIALLGLLVRIPFLGHGLWFDELAAIGDFTKHGPGPILGAWFTPSNHVLQSLLTWMSAQAFGADESSLRAPSWVAGTLAIVWMHALGRRVGGVRLGYAAALVMALMPVAVLETTEARGYGLVIFFTTVACWAFLRGMQDGEPWTWVVMAFAGAAATWSHFVAALVMVGFALVVVAVWFSRRREPLLRMRAQSAMVGIVMSGAMAITMLAPLLPDVIAGRALFAATDGDTPSLQSEEGLRLILMLGGTWAAALPPLPAALPGLLIMVIGLWSARRTPWARFALLASMAGFPLLILLALGGSWTYARFASFVVPGVALALALGVMTLIRFQRQLGVMAIAMLVASALVELALLPPRQPLRDAWEEVASRKGPGEIGIDLGLRGNISSFYAPPNMPVAPSGVLGSDLVVRLAEPRARWVVVTYPDFLPPQRWRELRDAGFEQDRAWPGWIDWGRGRVELWVRK
ncbi:MAG: glycosyltransferase family 39 protein [Phycisphaeraceae bacterium]|nr:glycosyltransferase family 39 protein [Phycisphaeraceae bacterium]